MTTKRKKTLTEGGNLKEQFNMSSHSIRGSVASYKRGLNTFILNKELGEYNGRFVYNKLPSGMNTKLIETMLYSKGQLVFFQLGGKYYILPFTFSGSINHYGIQVKGLPISYSGTLPGDTNGDNKPSYFGSELHLIFYDGQVDEEELTNIKATGNIGVVLKSQSSLNFNAVIPPIVLTAELRDKLAENATLVRSNMILSQPVKYVSVTNGDQAKNLMLDVDNMFAGILNGEIVRAIVGNLNTHDFNTEAPKNNQQELWQSFASLDNLRMEYLGILNNGVFEKKERTLTDEVAGKQAVAKLLLEDALNHRQEFCRLINKYFGLDVSVELSPAMKPIIEKEPIDNREGGGVDNDNV